MCCRELDAAKLVAEVDFCHPASSSFDSRGLIKGMVTSKTMSVCHCEKEHGIGVGGGLRGLWGLRGLQPPIIF